MSKFNFNAEQYTAEQEKLNAGQVEVVEEVKEETVSVEPIEVGEVEKKSSAKKTPIKKHVDVNPAYREAYQKYMLDAKARKEHIESAQQTLREALARRKVHQNEWAQQIAELRLAVAEAKAVPALYPPRKDDY